MNDRFNETMSCGTQFFFLHVIFRRSQMLLTFSRYQMMYNVSFVALCAEVICKRYSVIQQQSKEQNEALELLSLLALLQIDALFPSKQHNFYSFLLNLSTLLCCIELAISHSWMIIPKARIMWRLRKTLFEQTYNFCVIICFLFLLDKIKVYD